MSAGELDRIDRDTELDLVGRVAEFDAAGRAAVEEMMPDNTRDAFAQDWAHWTRFCGGHDVPPDTVSSGLLVGFVAWLARGGPEHVPQAPSTIKRRLTGVLAGWSRLGCAAPHGITSDARKALEGLERSLATAAQRRGRGPARALTVPELRRIVTAIPDDLRGQRDRVIFAVGFGMAARRSELAALQVSDIVVEAQGLVVTVRPVEGAAKTPRVVAIEPGAHPLTDPLRRWRAWLDASGITDGPALRQIHATGALQPKGVTGETVGSVVASRGEDAGVYGLTGHSLRRGLVTASRQAGHDRKTISATTGHAAGSDILDGYIEIVDRWADNATKGIGL